jgi:integrase/recombinase XerD
MVYGLRYYYRLLGMNKNAIALPSLKKETKLPVILNQKELKELFAAPTLLKQRVVLTLIYSAGLRGQEVRTLTYDCSMVRSPMAGTACGVSRG